MEPIFLTCMVIAFFFTKSKVDGKAYEAGKEPPGVAKARLRHESGGGARSATGKPKGSGAFRLALASRWANACEAARQRGDHKAARRRAWYDAEVAPRKDVAWKEKQRRKMEKKEASQARWARNRGLIDLIDFRDPEAEEEAWRENERREAQGSENPATDPVPETPPSTGRENLSEQQRQLVDRIEDAWSQGELVEPGFSHKAWWDLPVEVRADLFKAAQRGGLPIDTTFDPEAHELAGFPADRRAPEAKSRPKTEPMDPPTMGVCIRIISGGFCGKAAADPSDENKTAAWLCPDHLNTGEQPTPAAADTVPAAAGTGEDAKTGQPTKDTASPAPEVPTQNTGTTEGNSTVYEDAVTRLNRAADQIAEYRAELSAFADTLAGKQWGVEVTGPIQDMDSQLAAIEGSYRGLSEQMKNQGDQGAAAYDQAPWVPGPEAVLA